MRATTPLRARRRAPSSLAITRFLLSAAIVAALSLGELRAQTPPRAEPAATASDSTPPVATARWAADRVQASRSALELDLSRALGPGERLAMVIGNTDVSAGLELAGTRARFRPVGWRLPAGDAEVVTYLVDAAGGWREIGRAPLKVATRLGFERARVAPSIDLNSTGQLDHSVDPGQVPGRGAYQDLTVRIGIENSVAHRGWELQAQGNVVGVTQESQRLRWAARQIDAPALDLADYRVQVARGGVRLALGNVTAGANRHLINGFGSRGLSAGVRLGPVASFDAAVVNGSNVVGWSNPLGLARSDHRIALGTLSLELLPNRPGGLHVDVSGLDGSLLPETGFTQGAATDAEESRGFGFQVMASDARQRVRFSGGIARSRFVNPGDPLLFGDTAVVAVQPTTRSARYGELGLQLLQDLKLGGTTAASLAATVRHERVDPLYRSVGGYLQSDVQNDGLDLTGSVGALSFQAAATAARDNLGKLAAVLTSRTRTRSVSVAAPLGQLLGLPPTVWALPALNYSWQRTRQYGEGLPDEGGFQATHVPDQWSTAQTGSAAWSAPTWTLTYRWNQSFQDNRQTGRESADFRGIVHGVSLGLNAIRGLTPSLDVSVERQKNFESGLTQRTERFGGSAQAQLTRTTAFSGSVSEAWGFDPFADQRTRNTEFQVELSQGFNLYRRVDGGTQARVFVRYARTRASLLPTIPVSGLVPRVMWTFNAGGSIRLY